MAFSASYLREILDADADGLPKTKRKPTKAKLCCVSGCTRFSNSKGKVGRICRFHLKEEKQGLPYSHPPPRFILKGRLCMVESCGRSADAKGKCAMHYRRWKDKDPAWDRPIISGPKRIKGAKRKKVCGLHFFPDVIAEIDKRRGSLARGSWCANIIIAYLTTNLVPVASAQELLEEIAEPANDNQDLEDYGVRAKKMREKLARWPDTMPKELVQEFGGTIYAATKLRARFRRKNAQACGT